MGDQHGDQIVGLISADPTNKDAVYEVRVLKRWKVPPSEKNGSSGGLDMVLIDKDGFKIHATVPNDVLFLFDDEIQEGKVYRMSCLSVSFNRGDMLPSYHIYKLIFNEDSKVVPSSNVLIPVYGFALVAAESVLTKRKSFNYMIDVVGVVTHVKHDKNFYPDGKVTRSVTFKLNNERKSFYCELTGDLVDEFHKNVKSVSDGLPIVVLQFAQVNTVQGSILVCGIEGVTRLFVNPYAAEVINFRNGLISYLSGSPNYGGLLRRSAAVPLSHSFDFIKGYPVKTIAELKDDPTLGTFVVNARMIDIVRLDPWWYPICDCRQIFDKYIGAFHCMKCRARELTVSPKVRLTIEVDDETGSTIFTTFDHVMLDVAVVNSQVKAINIDQFYDAFKTSMGKSVMFIVKKDSHEPDFIGPSFELIRVSDSPAVIKYFINRGQYNTPSKVVAKKLLNKGKKKSVVSAVVVTRNTIDLIDENMVMRNPSPAAMDVASSSGSKRPRE